MAYVLARRLPADLLRLIDQLAREAQVLASCARCRRELLLGERYAALRAHDTFTYVESGGGLSIETASGRCAWLAARHESGAERPCARTLHLARDVEACGPRAPRWLRLNDRLYINASERMVQLSPFTRLGGAAVCLHCQEDRRAMRRCFAQLRL